MICCNKWFFLLETQPKPRILGLHQNCHYQNKLHLILPLKAQKMLKVVNVIRPWAITNLSNIRKFSTQCGTTEGHHHWETSICYAEVGEENSLNFYRSWNHNSQITKKISLGFVSYFTDPFWVPQIGKCLGKKKKQKKKNTPNEAQKELSRRNTLLQHQENRSIKCQCSIHLIITNCKH